jgi:hypothetical protein
MEFLTQLRWSPYAVGIGIGILSWFTFLISRKPIACSTSFAKTCGSLWRWLVVCASVLALIGLMAAPADAAGIML